LPSDKQHKQKAEHNKEFLNEIFINKHYSEKYPDWGVTVVFYTAYHHVHAFLAKKFNEHPRDHQDCLRLVRRFLSVCFLEYNQLYNDSRIARYIETTPPYIITKERLEEDIEILSKVFEKL